MRIWQRFVAAIRAPFVGFSSESPPRPIDQVILDMSGLSNTIVSRDLALSVPAVQRGRNLICSISTLPLVLRGADQSLKRSRLLEQIDPDVPNVVTLAQTIEDLLFDSIAWWEVIEQEPGPNGYPTACRRRDPNTVSLHPPNTVRSPAPLPSGYDPRGASVWVDGREVPFSRIIRFDSPNPAVRKAAARAIRRAILLDAAAAMYADESRPMDYFTPTEGVDPVDDTEVQAILDGWKAERKKRGTAYVPAALKYNAVDQPNPRDLQLVELQRQAALDLANAIGLDPEDLGISTTSRTYANAVDRRRDRINDVLSPYMRAITDRLSMGDVTRRGSKADWDLDDYMRSNPTERVAYYTGLHALGAIDAEEIRTEEKLGPMTAGLKRAQKQKEAQAATDPEGSEVDENTVAASREAMYAQLRADGLRLSGAEDDNLHFADVPVTGFTVDRQRRIIEGLALPYGRVAEKYGLKFRFLKGSLKWAEPTRVKLNVHHDVRQTVGYAADIRETADGLRMRFKVKRGPEGDKALQEAEDKVLDGLSVGVGFDAGNDAEMDGQGVMNVRRGDLRHVALTPEPAFDDARVTKVAASRTEGTTGMPEQETEATEPQTTPPAPGGLNLNQDQLTALLTQPGAIQALVAAQQVPAAPATPRGGLTLSAEQVQGLIKSGGLGVLLGVPQVTPAIRTEPEEKRPTVNPTRVQASTTVEEELPYRFDRSGNLTRGSEYDFSTDLVNWTRGDGEALTRATKFVQSQAALFENYEQALPTLVKAQFDTSTTDVAALNPNRNRPDMYVDQKSFTYPIWEAISKGTLADIVPFVLPKFATASGQVAAHVEGVEPTAGVYTAGSQTITPSAVSGKMVLNREAWDAGGNPQLSGIVWRQMLKAWYESLEAASVAMLDALSPTQFAITTAARDDVLVDELEQYLAGLQFVRGGFTLDDFFLQIDLYKALAGAVDGEGRRLIPRLNPTNASGRISDKYADLDIGGLRGRPGWALAASGSVAASSYLFDRNDVHGWASAPNRLQFEYQVKSIEIGIWGYKALAATDLTGVREVVYDPQ